METNFFTKMKPILEKGIDLTLTLRVDGENLVIGVRPTTRRLKDDKELNNVKPLVLTHPAEKLDESFFTTILAPSMETYDSAVQVAAGTKSFAEDVAKALDEDKPTVKKSVPTPTSKSKKGGKKKPVPVKKSVLAKAVKPDAPTAVDKAAKAAEEKRVKIDGIVKDARILFNAGDFDPATIKLREAFKLDKENADAKELQDEINKGKINREVTESVKIARLNLDNGDAESAVRCLDSVIKANADHPAIVMVLGEINDAKCSILLAKATKLREGTEFAEAVKVLKQLFVLVPDHAGGVKLRKAMETTLGAGFVGQLFASDKL